MYERISWKKFKYSQTIEKWRRLCLAKRIDIMLQPSKDRQICISFKKLIQMALLIARLVSSERHSVEKKIKQNIHSAFHRAYCITSISFFIHKKSYNSIRLIFEFIFFCCMAACVTKHFICMKSNSKYLST